MSWSFWKDRLPSYRTRIPRRTKKNIQRVARSAFEGSEARLDLHPFSGREMRQSIRLWWVGGCLFNMWFINVSQLTCRLPEKLGKHGHLVGRWVFRKNWSER